MCVRFLNANVTQVSIRALMEFLTHVTVEFFRMGCLSLFQELTPKKIERVKKGSLRRANVKRPIRALSFHAL